MDEKSCMVTFGIIFTKFNCLIEQSYKQIRKGLALIIILEIKLKNL